MQASSVQADEMKQAECDQEGGQSQAGLIKALHPTPLQVCLSHLVFVYMVDNLLQLQYQM